jgi:hypothetical protein
LLIIVVRGPVRAMLFATSGHPSRAIGFTLHVGTIPDGTVY